MEKIIPGWNNSSTKGGDDNCVVFDRNRKLNSLLLLFLLLVVDPLVATVVAVANGHEATKDGNTLAVVMPAHEFGNKACQNIKKNTLVKCSQTAIPNSAQHKSLKCKVIKVSSDYI